MAIKVNGTTVVDDSRNLTNIASVDATTVAALSAAGVGDITAVTAGSGLTGGGTSGAVTINHQDTSSQDSVNNSGNTVIQDVTLDTYGHVTGLTSTTISAGPSTAYGGVGTYGLFLTKNTGTFQPGTTASGSSLYVLSQNDGLVVSTGRYNTSEVASAGRSGTWRRMAKQSGNNYSGTSNDNAGITLWVRIS